MYNFIIVYYIRTLYKLFTLRLGSSLSTGLFINLLRGVNFFLTIKPELIAKEYSKPERLSCLRLDLEKNTLAMSPFTLYLYLKPLYSILGGSTLLADPFTKNPIFVDFLWNPL